MKLVSIKPSNFRGFGSADWIDLDCQLVTIFGPNGFGKTSMAEALEWLLYGETKRRRRGDNYSKLEYRGTYANVHTNAPVEVSAKIRLADGTVRVITRRLVVGSRTIESSETFIDGHPADFRDIGLVADEAYYPIIVQHGLQDFIHTPPKQRRNAISAALGLEALVSFKDALDRARRSFQSTPPEDVERARTKLLAACQKLKWNTHTMVLARTWESDPRNVDLTSDWNTLIRAAQTTLQVSISNPNQLISHLKKRREELGARVFDLSGLRPAADLAQRIHSAKKQETLVHDAIRALKKAVDDFVAATASVYGAELLSFWELGLRLSESEDSNLCPMCEEPTLPKDKRTILEDRIRGNKARTEAHKALSTAVATLKNQLTTLRQHLGSLQPHYLDDSKRSTLESLLSDIPGQATKFLETHDKFRTTLKDVDIRFTNHDATLSQLPRALDDPARIADSRHFVKTLPKDIEDAVRKSISIAEAYIEKFETLEEVIGERIATDAAVREIDAILAGLEVHDHIETIHTYNNVLESLNSEVRAVESFLQGKQKDLLATRGQEVREWYDLMNPGADVRFIEMEPATDSLKLHAESFGKKMSAPACLSESQLNCLGLSVYLMRATTPESPFGFVVFDDPVQSMDDDHCESFIINVVPKLIDEFHKQVIVLTHIKHIADRIRDLNVDRNPLQYHLEEYNKNGPSVVPYVRIQREIHQVRTLAKGNEANRKLAVDRIRVLVEVVIRELYLKVNGCPLPAQYNKATAKDLLPVFQSIEGTTPAEHQGIRDTVSFSDPAHHTQADWQVPTLQQIEPHIQRLLQIAKKHQLIG